MGRGGRGRLVRRGVLCVCVCGGGGATAPAACAAPQQPHPPPALSPPPPSCAAAQYLADAGLADPARLCIDGGSAGGFTTLACMGFKEVFAAGASHYGVADLALLAKETHKVGGGGGGGAGGGWQESTRRAHDDRLSALPPSPPLPLLSLRAATWMAWWGPTLPLLRSTPRARPSTLWTASPAPLPFSRETRTRLCPPHRCALRGVRPCFLYGVRQGRARARHKHTPHTHARTGGADARGAQGARRAHRAGHV